MTNVAPFVVGESGSLRDLEYAIWEVRLTVLLQLRHWKLRALDVWTVAPAEPVGLQSERLIAHAIDEQARVQT